MDAPPLNPWSIVLRGLMMFFVGGWIVFYCAHNLIDFMDTGVIDWPELFKGYHPLPLLIVYETHPVVATVAVVITALGEFMGVCAVIFGVSDFWKLLSS
jgi:hypothetical protein